MTEKNRTAARLWWRRRRPGLYFLTDAQGRELAYVERVYHHEWYWATSTDRDSRYRTLAAVKAVALSTIQMRNAS